MTFLFFIRMAWHSQSVPWTISINYEQNTEFGFTTPPKFMICIYNLQYGILKEFLSRVIRSPPLKLIKFLLGQSAHKIEIENMRAHCKTLIKTYNGLKSIMKDHCYCQVSLFLVIFSDTFKVCQVHELTSYHKFHPSGIMRGFNELQTSRAPQTVLVFYTFVGSCVISVSRPLGKWD